MLVLPSLNEGMGRVLIEAMAGSKPVVGSCVGGIPDLIEHKVNGLLFPVDDVNALADAIIGLLKDEDSRLEMGRRGKLKVCRFEQSEMVCKIHKLYEDLAKDI